MKKLSNSLHYCINLLFLLIIGFVFLQASVFNSQYKYTLLLLPLTIATLLLVIFFHYILTKFEYWICRNYKCILAIFLISMFLIQITLGLKFLRFHPTWDLSAVYNGAIAWLNNGNINEYKDYFYYYPNNLGALLLFKLIFSFASFLGITDFFSVASIFNSILSISMMYLIITICSDLLGQKYGVLSGFIITLCYPFYFISTVFYTDSLTMIFPVLIYYIYIKSKKTVSSYHKVLCYFSMIFLTVIGIQIKFTVLIILIAIFFDLLINYKIKTLLLLILSTVIISSCISSMINNIVYPQLLDYEQAQEQNTPYIRWIMMGLKGNGTYNREDSVFARSFDNSIVRDVAIKKEIIHRINLLGYRGICQLVQKKTQRCFGDGTLGLSDFLDDAPIKQNILHEIVTYNGKYYPLYKTFCHSTFLSIMILMFLYSITSIKNVDNSTSTDLVLKLSFIGLWVFLMIWESTARYFSNYISIMLIISVMGCKHLEQYNWGDN